MHIALSARGQKAKFGLNGKLMYVYIYIYTYVYTLMQDPLDRIHLAQGTILLFYLLSSIMSYI